jgi:signal transduction histidine kinase
MTARLPVRLFASYLAVVAVGVVASYLTVRLLLPPLFEHRMGNAVMGQRHGGTRLALSSALNTALLVAVVVTTVASGVAAALITRRLLRPLTAVQSATRKIAAGEYDASVPLPREPELAALAADVNTLAGTLADTERRRTSLLGDVAHEMRTPLTALDGYVEGIIDGVFEATPHQLQAMSQELHRLHRLADDLSSLSRTEEQRLDLRLSETDLAELARRTGDRLRPQFDDAGVSLTVQADTAVSVSVDVDRIAQVLSNLLGNALLATPPGGSVTAAVAADRERATVSVTDTGVGLRPAELERIFERFYRAGNGPRRSPGSGVGLTIARGIARAHGGELRAASPGPGQGATFTLVLPRAGAMVGRPAQPPA